MSDGTRTRDRRDHNPELYQLSYAHQGRPNLAVGRRRADAQTGRRRPPRPARRRAPVRAWNGSSRAAPRRPTLPAVVAQLRAVVPEASPRADHTRRSAVGVAEPGLAARTPSPRRPRTSWHRPRHDVYVHNRTERPVSRSFGQGSKRVRGRGAAPGQAASPRPAPPSAARPAPRAPEKARSTSARCRTRVGSRRG